MSTSLNQPSGTRSTSSTFWKILTVVSLVLACGELLLTLHYRSQLASPGLVARSFQKVYYDSLVWTSTKWLGVPSEQAPTDNWNMQQLIVELQPDYIVETGTLYGGTTLFYAEVLS